MWVRCVLVWGVVVVAEWACCAVFYWFLVCFVFVCGGVCGWWRGGRCRPWGLAVVQEKVVDEVLRGGC